MKIRLILSTILGAALLLSSPAYATSGSAPLPTRALKVCFTTVPSGWAGTLRATFPTMGFLVSAVAGRRAYGFFSTQAGDEGIAVVELRTGALTQLVTFPADSSGLISLAVGGHWLAWVQGNSRFQPLDWTLFARNLQTGEQLTLATSRQPDGTIVAGPQPQLALRDGLLTWAQPIASTVPGGAAEARVYDLQARRQSVLDTGQVNSPVFGGRLVVWGHILGKGTTELRAVDASTLRPIALPEQIRSQPGVLFLAGSSRFLVWSTDYQHALAWRMKDGQLTSYAISDKRNPLQFLQLSGHFLMWYTGFPFAVLDLDTGGAFDTPVLGGAIAGSIAGSQTTIVRSEPLSVPPSKGGIPGSAVSSLRTASAPSIPGCAV
jgi:hypothetical protein